MNVEKLLASLGDKEKLAVIEFALPGISIYLQETLSKEVLTEEGEKLRRHYVEIINKGKAEQNGCKQEKNSEKYLEMPEAFSRPMKQSISEDRDDHLVVKRTSELYQQSAACDGVKHNILTEKCGSCPLTCRRDTENTNGNGVYSRLPHSDCETDAVTPRNLQTSASTSRETILTDNSEFEVADWDTESAGNLEEGYYTGDNAISDVTVDNYSFEPNEVGEIYSGTLYIREPPGWHKRWFILNEQCLKCYRHRTEDKMLFEIPLKRAKLVAIDKRRSKVFPFSLSVPVVKEVITFATTDGRSRQQWVCVLGFVISKLAKQYFQPNGPEIDEEHSLSHSAFGQGGNCNSPVQDNLGNYISHETNVIGTFHKHENENAGENERTLSTELINDDTWSSQRARKVAGPVEQWANIGLQFEEEEAKLDTSLLPEFADDEAFKELQECLPDILQRPRRITGSNRKHRAAMSKTQSSSEIHINEKGFDDKARNSNQTLDTNSQDEFAKAFSAPDLRSPPKVKRHGSLTTVLSNKASRVKSKLTTSFFKKGKKVDTRHHKDFMTKSTTFSGYLLRKKGAVWKNRWCVVKEHKFFCYKDFGVPVSELEFHLEGCIVNCLQESDAEKPFVFTIRSQNDVLFLAAENDAELEEWIMVLETESALHESSSCPDTNSSRAFMSSSIFPPSQRGTELVTSSHDRQQDISMAESSNSGYPGSSSQNTEVKQKSSPSAPKSKKALFSSLTQKFGQKSKAKPYPSPVGTVSVEKKRDLHLNSIEDGFVIVPRGLSADQQIPFRAHKIEDDETVGRSESPLMLHSKEGYLHQRVDDNAWLKCWVKLENCYLRIHDDKEYEDAVVLKIRLANCIVLDCENENKPWVLEIKRSFGQSLFLQADSETAYNEWKQAISKSILSSPLPPRRPTPDQSISHREHLKLSSREKYAETEDVFQKELEEYCESPLRNSVAPSLHINQSPRPSTAGDISSGEDEEGVTVNRNVCQTESDKMKKVDAPRKYRKVRRAITNAFASKKANEYTARRRRSRTVAGVNVALNMLTNVKHSSCLYIKNAAGLWAKRWCVLQNHNLHFFKYADDQKPSLSLNINQPCEVRRVIKRSKRFTFDIALPKERAEYCFAADNEREMYRWMDVLRSVSSDNGNEKGVEAISLEKRAFDLVRSSGEGSPTANQNPDITKDLCDVLTIEPQMRASSLQDLRLDRVSRGDFVREERLNRSTDDVTTNAFRGRVTSLEDVLKLLQDQQILQQIGQSKHNKSKRAQLQWKRSAAVALGQARSCTHQEEQNFNTFADSMNITDAKPRSPAASFNEFASKNDEVDGKDKSRAPSLLSISSSGTELDETLSRKEIMEKIEKLAEEEKLKLLRNETLLRKRRNSLTLEKDVLQKKMGKNQDKKSAVRKFLAKEDPSKAGPPTVVSGARLQEVNQQLLKIERSLKKNKKQSADVSVKLMNSKVARKKSSVADAVITRLPSNASERRTAFKNSPTSSERSLSSQGSFEEKCSKEIFDSTHTRLTKKVSLTPSVSSSTSLAALEEELRKITPLGARRLTEPRRKKMSVSSEGSPDTRESPLLTRRAYSELPKRTASASSESSSASRESPSFSGLESLGSCKKSPGPSEVDNEEVQHWKFSRLSEISLLQQDAESFPNETNTAQRKDSTDEETYVKLEHQATFINALSRIKDFEEFTATVSKREWDQ